jgi:hypothetical protein
MVNFTITTSPEIASSPSPLTAYTNGFFLNGAAFINGIGNNFGMDANITEVTDCYMGHPQETDLYHHHAFNVIDFYQKGFTVSTQPTLAGFMGDGFPILAAMINSSTGNLYTSSELDECHGLAFPDGIEFTISCNTFTYYYAYVCTFDFPYLATAFKGTVSTSFYNAWVQQATDYTNLNGAITNNC